MSSDSDLPDDIFAPAPTIGRTSKFNPRLRINNKNTLPKLSKSSASEGPSSSEVCNVADIKLQPVEGSSVPILQSSVLSPSQDYKGNSLVIGGGESKQCTDASCYSESLEAVSDYNQANAMECVKTVDSVICGEDFADVLAEDFGSLVSRGSSELHGFSQTCEETQNLEETKALFDAKSLDKSLFEINAMPEGKKAIFQPKLCTKRIKLAPHASFDVAKPCVPKIKSPEQLTFSTPRKSTIKTCDFELHDFQNPTCCLDSNFINHGTTGMDEKESGEASGQFASVEMHENIINSSSSLAGDAGPDLSSNLDFNCSETISISSNLEAWQNPITSEEFETNVDDSVKACKEPPTMPSNVVDDLFLQSNPNTAQQASKFQPKPVLCVKLRKKTKEVSFALPNNDGELSASIEHQSDPVTSDVFVGIASFTDMMIDKNMEDRFQTLTTCNIDNEVDHVDIVRQDVDISGFDTGDVISDPVCNSGSGIPAEDVIELLEATDNGYFASNLFEERACFDNSYNLQSQPLYKNVDLHTMEGGHLTNNIEEPTLEDGSYITEQSEKSSKKARRMNTKLRPRTEKSVGIDQEMNGEYNGDHVPEKKKRKLSKSSKNESSIMSSKKVEPSYTVKQPPKKRLPHGSLRCRRAKRQVNKSLLEIPYDELDRSQLAIRDLIRLAGFKERISNKDAAALKRSSASQSEEKTLPDEEHHSGQENEEDPNGDDSKAGTQQNGQILNYHSYMRTSRRNRWSNTDIDMFYQAIRQFGTDFAMIQLLFPDRNRQQIKAKFKNEQRKHPLQIADALVHRSKDHSHFEKAIKHLQTIADQNSKKEESDSTIKSQDEFDPNEEERTEVNSEEVHCSEDDLEFHLKSNYENDFDHHLEASYG